MLHHDGDGTHLENQEVLEWNGSEWEVTVPCMTSVGESLAKFRRSFCKVLVSHKEERLLDMELAGAQWRR